MNHLKIVIAGGTGFIGQSIVKYFAGNDIAVIGRGDKATNTNAYPDHKAGNLEDSAVQYYQWDGKHACGNWTSALEGADLVINLAGRTVNCRYNESNKKEILESRVQATAAVGEAIRQCASPPELWINAASATIYPHAEDQPRDEYTKNFHNDFSVQVCKKWEAEFWRQSTTHTRKVCLRIAITLGHGGVMTPYLKMVKWGLGGRQGNGKQMFSWIHIEDVYRIIGLLMEHENLAGVFNCSSPNPVTNEVFMEMLRNSLNKKLGLPSPAWLLKIGAFMIATETELILKSRWVVPDRLLTSGYTFTFPLLKDAFEDLLR